MGVIPKLRYGGVLIAFVKNHDSIMARYYRVVGLIQAWANG